MPKQNRNPQALPIAVGAAALFSIKSSDDPNPKPKKSTDNRLLPDIKTSTVSGYPHTPYAPDNTGASEKAWGFRVDGDYSGEGEDRSHLAPFGKSSATSDSSTVKAQTQSKPVGVNKKTPGPKDTVKVNKKNKPVGANSGVGKPDNPPVSRPNSGLPPDAPKGKGKGIKPQDKKSGWFGSRWWGGLSRGTKNTVIAGTSFALGYGARSLFDSDNGGTSSIRDYYYKSNVYHY